MNLHKYQLPPILGGYGLIRHTPRTFGDMFCPTPTQYPKYPVIQRVECNQRPLYKYPKYPIVTKGVKAKKLVARYLLDQTSHISKSPECNPRPLANIRITGLRQGWGCHRVTPKTSPWSRSEYYATDTQYPTHATFCTMSSTQLPKYL